MLDGKCNANFRQWARFACTDANLEIPYDFVDKPVVIFRAVAEKEPRKEEDFRPMPLWANRSVCSHGTSLLLTGDSLQIVQWINRQWKSTKEAKTRVAWFQNVLGRWYSSGNWTPAHAVENFTYHLYREQHKAADELSQKGLECIKTH